jgi:glycosyltransferase involved in cell wall biosynthesis
MMRRGVEVDVACNSGDERFDRLARSGMKMLPLTVGPWKSAATWLTLRRELRQLMARKAYDMCVVHTPAISWITRRLAARASIPVVAYTAHGLPFFERQGACTYRALLAVETFCGRYTDLLMVMNSVDLAAAREHRLVKPGGLVRHIPGVGVDTQRWQRPTPPEKLHALRQELSLEPQTRVVAYIGRLMDTKGVLDLVEALSRLCRSGRDVALVVAGTGPLDGAMAEAAARGGVADRLHLLGWRDDVTALMALADVVALPSTYREGLPAVLMEAAAAGKPVVAYRNRGSDDIIVDGETGRSVPARDVAALTDAVGRLVDDADLARRMGDAGRRRVNATFGYLQAVRAQLGAYADALEAKGIDASQLRGDLGQPVFSLAEGQGGP